MISNYLGGRPNKVPQNMPSFQPRISPSLDFNLNSMKPTLTTTSEQLSSLPHYMPVFISDTLIVHGLHQVYVSYVDDGPYMFSIQLKSSEQKMEQMMADIANSPLQPLSRKAALGMACLARYSADKNIYRAVVKSIYRDSCQLLYVDYGNSETVSLNHIYDIPEHFLRLKTFAIRVSLAGLNALPPLSQDVKTFFKNTVADKTLDMVVVPPDGKAFVQYCELRLNGENLLNRLKDIVSKVPKFLEPATLSDDDVVVIRFVESPKLFYVQQTKNIVEYENMMDKLYQYCEGAPFLNEFEKGVACAARYKDDKEWYRAEIISVNGSDALIRFVDFGIELKTKARELKEISYEFLSMPKQAVLCCLFAFDTMQTLSNSARDQMELLAEDTVGERRNFRVKVHGNVGNAMLVNLIDESQVPYLDLSKRMLQLSLSQKSFKQYELKLQNKTVAITRSAGDRPAIITSANDGSDAHFHAALNEKSTSDSGFQDSTSTRISKSDATQRTPDRDNRSNGRSNPKNNNRNDSGMSSITSAGHSETFKIDVKDSKFYKNTVNPMYESNDQR